MKKAIVREALNTFTKKIGATYFLNDNDLTEKFDGDTLVVAKVYREKIRNTVKNYDGVVCGLTIQNAKVHTFRALTKPIVKDINNPCSRCSGTGLMPFKHVKGGVCFKCNGTGSSKK